MESINGRLRLDVSDDQIQILLESFVNRGYQVCCDWDWQKISNLNGRHTWYFIYDHQNYRFMELYHDSEVWVLQESHDLVTRKIYPDRGEQPWKNLKTQNQMLTKMLSHPREGSSTV